MKNTLKYLGTIALVAILSFACAKNSTDTKQQFEVNAATPSAKVFSISDVKSGGNNKAADFSWTENGKTRKFSELTKGKVVFLNFWGTWCPPCRAEIPDIVEISNELASKGLVVIGMANERATGDEAIAKVKEFALSKKVTYYNFISNDKVRELYGGINFVPQTFIIDKNGNIVETINGMRQKDEFVKIINKYLK